MSRGPHSLEFSSTFLPRAVHLAYTIGIHQPINAERDQKVAGLFSSLWSVDRMQAAMHGRPVLMHELDMAKSPCECSQQCSSGFRTLAYITTLQDSVTALYHPRAEASEFPDSNFSTFNETLDTCGSTQPLPQALDTGELFYHGVAILSVPSPGPGPGGRKSRSSRQLPRPCSSIMEQRAVGDVVLLPFVPCSASLYLGELGSSFWSASFMAEVATQIL